MKNNTPSKYASAAGIYAIKNSVNKRIYIGSTNNFTRRFNEHAAQLKNKRHSSEPLQAFVNKYGINTLSFDIICVCAKDKLFLFEQYYIDYYKASEAVTGFNVCPIAGAVGRKARPRK